MPPIKEQVLRELGDSGADTLERYFAQIEYTAYWCIRMLLHSEGIESVIPEGGEDLVIVRQHIHELHQIKTRDESQGVWSTAEILPILCKQYRSRVAFQNKCIYYFVSNQMADNKTMLRANTYGPLYRLKELINIKSKGQSLNLDEQTELSKLEEVIIPRIQQLMLDEYAENLDDVVVRDLLYNTRIVTNCDLIRKPDNPTELQTVLSQLLPGEVPYKLVELQAFYDRLLLLIIRKIIRGTSRAQRCIRPSDVLDCRIAPIEAEDGYPDLSKIPGRTLLEKKTRLGGFDITEISTFRRRKALSTQIKRELDDLGLERKIGRLILDILDAQRKYRHFVCRNQGVVSEPGPKILEMVEEALPSLIESHFPKSAPEYEQIDVGFCLGLLWLETDLCQAWWHGFDNSENRGVA